MKIVLSESLSRHFAELDFSVHPNVDRLLSLTSRYDEQRDDNWAQLRCAAKLVADECVMVKPDYNALAAKTRDGSGTRWLQNALSVDNKASAPEPKLLADPQRLEQFLTQRIELGPRSATSSAAQVAGVAEFVAAVMDLPRQRDVSVFLSPDPVYNRACLEMTRNITA